MKTLVIQRIFDADGYWKIWRISSWVAAFESSAELILASIETKNLAEEREQAEGMLDVVVIGAGLSGIQAALEVQRAGFSCIILEARDRIGGKTFTKQRKDGKGKQDVGAAWMNDTNQSRMAELAQKFGLKYAVQNTSGNVVVQDFDGGLVTFPYGEVPEYASSDETEDCVRIRDLVEATSTNESLFCEGTERSKLDSLSFEAWVREQNAGKRASATAMIWTHAMLGVDPSEVSALYFLEYCKAGGGLMTMRSDCKDGGQYLRPLRGTSVFAEEMAKMLNAQTVKLSSPVFSIQQHDTGVEVHHNESSGGTNVVRARKAIFSGPTPVYRDIVFDPPLPNSKTTVINSTRYGYYTKYIVAFRHPFWRDLGACGLAQSFLGPVSVFRDTSVDEDDNYCLTCFIGGIAARKWSAGTAEEKLGSVLNQISIIFNGGRKVDDMFLEILESPWMQEKWSGWGCPCPVMPPGVLDKGFAALCAPFGNVHFVGTETATVWRGYMEGAIRSGEKGAAEVIAELQDVSKSREAPILSNGV